MDSFEKKMREDLALISAVGLHINSLTDEFYVNLQFAGHVNELSVGICPLPHRRSGDEGPWRVFYMSTYLDECRQNDLYRKNCTVDQMLYVLRQIRQSLIEGRIGEIAA